MSVSSAMTAGVSGIAANSAAMSAISDNIVNLNTVGYKQNRTDFLDLVTPRAAAGLYNSGGVQASVRQSVTQQGQLSQTASPTDLGISGSGFFVTTDKATGLTPLDTRTFTRAGTFTLDNQGFLKNAAGLYLQGWTADPQGNVATNPSDLGSLSTIKVDPGTGAPNPSTLVGVSANLDSTQAISPQEAGYTVGGMAAYDPVAGTGVKPDYSLQVPVYDTKGGKHIFEVDMLKSATANQWHTEVRAIPASEVQGTTNGLLTSGTIAFTPDGKFDQANTTLPTNIVVGASAGGAPPAWATNLGVAGQTVKLDLVNGGSGITQFAQSSGTNSVIGDGGAVGSLTNVSVNDNGDVIASFSNNLSRRMARVALATFPNPDGLVSISGPSYRVSQSSGTYTLKTPKEAGAGSISPSTLESSTVDLSAEFTGLIVTQRAYSACSKIISTADTMLQDIIDIKR